jgi:type I site-specific restriction-modification system R (restriction) subunit
VDELTRDRSAMSLEAANPEVYVLLKEGIKVSVPDRERGGQKTERVRVIDWENPAANDFLLVSQFSVTGVLYTCRPDLVGFVNGLPLVVIEFKKPSMPARVAFDENITSYKHPHTPRTEFLRSSPTTPSSFARMARTAGSARSRRIGIGSLSGNASNARTSRVGCRWR